MERIRLIAYKVKDGLSIRNSRFGHQFPPGYNRSVMAESSTPYLNVGSTKGPTAVTNAAYPYQSVGYGANEG
jgi:hypothetical protein